MEQKKLGSPGSAGSAGGGFRTGATPPRPYSKENISAYLGDPVRKLQTTPDLVIENSADCSLLSFSHTVPEQVSLPAETGSSERPRVHFPEKAEPERRAVVNTPLLVDARCTRGSQDDDPSNKLEANFPECATLRGMNLEGAWPDSGSNDGRQSPAHPSWPESIGGGGATCSGPPHARKRAVPAREPLGEVLLLGSGLRAPLTARLNSSSAAPDQPPAGDSLAKPEAPEGPEAPEKKASGTGVDGDVETDKSRIEVSMRRSEAHDRKSSGTGSLESLKDSSKSSGKDGSKSKPLPSARSSRTAKDSAGTAVSGDALLQTTVKPTKVSKAVGEGDIIDEIQEQLQETTIQAVVEKYDVGLQTDAWTDAGPRGCSLGSQFAGASAENRRILLQRCDPKQVNLTSWMPLPKANMQVCAELQYLAHVRNRFPGTVDKNCRLEAASVTRTKDRPIATPRKSGT